MRPLRSPQEPPQTSKSIDSQRPPDTVQIASDQTMKDFKLEQMVDAALFASWKALPWQSRVCPRSLEERESVRLLASMVQEARRVKGWVGEQNQVAMEMASREDKRFAKFVVEERQRVTEFEIKEAKRVKDYESTQETTVKALEAEERHKVNMVIEKRLIVVLRARANPLL